MASSGNFGDPLAEPVTGAEFEATFTVRVGYSNGDFRHVTLKDDRGRVWASSVSVPFRALREIRDTPKSPAK